MNVATKMTDRADQEDCKFVDVLTASISGEAIGYRFGGGRPGPNALVAGDARLMEALFVRLNNLPTLPWMWGCLYLVTLDEIECTGMADIKRCLPDVPFDEMILHPYAPGPDTHDFSVERAYWKTLRLCRNLGMIAGRGISEKGI
ncbi:MAG: hypothetical protein WBB25_16875 [Sulfitobacter sp.]